MSDLPLAERVGRHLERHPDASPVAIAGALGVHPDDVEAVLDGDSIEPRAETDPTDEATDLPELDSEPEQHCESLAARDCWIPWRYIDGRKQPDAIYADTDNPMSWSDPDNWRDFESCQMAAQDPRIEGPGVILQHQDDPYDDAGDPFVLIDYDDVRDAETGETHPLVADHVEQAESYADVSTSGTGVHIIAKGELPDGVKTIQAPLPDCDAFPDAEIEVYDGSRFVAMTGAHIPSSPVEATESQAFLEDLVDEFVTEEQRTTPRPDRDEEWEPEFDREEVRDIETTDDLQAVVDAIRHITPRDIRLRSDQTEKRADGTRSFDPSWANSKSGTRLAWDRDCGWLYRRGDVGLDALQVVALEERIISSVHQYPDGEDWFDAVEALRDRGAHIPELDTDAAREQDDPHPLLELALEGEAEVDSEPTSTLPLGQLDALGPDERRRAARTRGVDWPSTSEARDRLQDTIMDVIRHEDDRVVDAPTALGKTYTTATTRWGARPDVTGGRPVVHLLETRDARDEAIEAAREHGGQVHVLRSRHEACPVAAGAHDPHEVHECDDEDRQVLTVDGDPASVVIDRLCDGKGVPFSVAHQYIADHNDQDTELPCGGDTCDAVTQWDTLREGPDDGETWPLVIATHNFAYAPGLRLETNIVIDEQPDYRQELSTERVRRAVTAYLQAIDAPVSTWEALVSLSQHEGYGDDAAHEREALADALYDEPDREWYIEHEDAHTLAPALARAVFNAEERANGRRAGKTVHEPPRLEANARDGDSWNREWVTVVLDDSNEIQQVRCTPDFSAARSVIGLDAHPSEPVWQANTTPWMSTRSVLDDDERRLWRRYERGLRVVQVGDATRPLSGSNAEDWLDDDRLRALLDHLRDEFGADFETAITTAQVESRLESLMVEAGISSPELMHYGEEKSRNDFAGEQVGLVNGCMDPGDGYVVDLLAELDLDAEPETAESDDGDEYRARGRGFVGDDAGAATAVLESVRANHVAQGAGRYARDADSDGSATVFVRTDAAPTGFVDVEVPGVDWTFTELQREIVTELRDAPGHRTAREIAEAVGCSKEHVRQTLDRLEDRDVVQALHSAAEHGASTYADDGLPNAGVVGAAETTNDPLSGTTNTWSLAIRDPLRPDDADASADVTASTQVWDWESATGGTGPPDSPS